MYATTDAASARRNSGGIRKTLNHRRAKKACQQCHIRKIRCNVVDSGIPCSNCVDSKATCTIEPRKNERRSSRNNSPSSEHQKLISDRCHTWQLGDAANGQTKAPTIPNLDAGKPTQASPEADNIQGWNEFNNDIYWDSNPDFADQGVADPGSAASASIDLSHLADLNDIFTFTRDAALPSLTQSNYALPAAYLHQDFASHALAPSSAANVLPDHGPMQGIALQVPGLSPSEDDYLRREGCMMLPPLSIFKDMMRSYFMMVHPNLPVIAEDEFWSLWNGEEFRLEGYSFLLVRAMIFASINFTELQTVQSIGFTSKREARLMFYRQAKMIFDIGVEKDPVANAQACLLLTYYAPSYNRLRTNAFWLGQAAHFGRIAHADLHYRVRERSAQRSRILKRLWWGVLMRDHILSLGLRRPLQVPVFPPAWSERESILRLDDFESELGNSPVHDLDTQQRIIEVLSAMCQLVQTLTGALEIYRYEQLDERLDAASRSLTTTVSDIKSSLNALRKWHDQAGRLFPFPIALDDAHENPAFVVYANMMFIYYSSTIFALSQHLILLAEAFPSCRSLFSIDDAREALETANNDIGRRVQEFVQVRLMKHLPISASAFIAIPLVLQAINVAAARGTSTEGAENRRLEIFLRTLKRQQENFDGSDFCADVLSNLVAYAQADETFISSMTNWRDSNGSSQPTSPGPNKVKLDWANLVYKRTRLFLRLMLYLDYALCTGGPPQDDDFPAVLRRSLP